MPNKTSARLPLALTSFSTATHSRTYFVPGATFGDNGSASGVFTRQNIGQFGNTGRNNYFGPNFFADDLSLLKNIPIHESIEAQFRMDAFNGFNYISPGNPNGACIDCAAAGSNGVITGMGLGSLPRQLQFAVTIKF
jgi:hypothetical protein